MSTVIRNCRKDKLLPNRPLDFIYDPVFTVSNAQDYYKTVSESMKYSTEFVMQPNFSSMFSEIQHYPNSSLILKSAYPLPHFINASFKGKSRAMRSEQCKSGQNERVQVDGADRFRYFRKPCDVGKEIVPKKASLQYKLLLTDYVDPSTEFFEKRKVAADMGSCSVSSSEPTAVNASRSIQTDYREAETQTIPWTPPYTFQGSVTPEILTLTYLSWGQGLPAGSHEIELIERARMKREWEHLLLNNFKTNQDMEIRQKCIVDMETNEWIFREQEIEKIHCLRMDLANKDMRGQKYKQFNRLDERVSRQIRRKENEKNEKLKSLQDKKDREMRKLMAKHKLWEKKLKSAPGVKESIEIPLLAKDEVKEKKSLLSTPKHEVIKYDKMMLRTVEGLILMENAPLDPAPAFNFVEASKTKSQFEMCRKYNGLSTVEDLEKLQKDLRSIHLSYLKT